MGSPLRSVCGRANVTAIAGTGEDGVPWMSTRGASRKVSVRVKLCGLEPSSPKPYRTSVATGQVAGLGFVAQESSTCPMMQGPPAAPHTAELV